MPYPRYTLILLLLSLAAPAAQGGMRTHFLSHGPSAAAFGRGETGGAVFDGISSVFYNPALGARCAGGALQVGHYSLAEGSQYNFAGAGITSSSGVFCGISAVNLRSGDTELRRYIDDDPQVARTSQWAGLVTVARSFGRSRGFSAGISAKYIALDMCRASGSSWGADAGLAYSAAGPRIGAGRCAIDTGLALQNIIAPEVTLVSSPDRWDTAGRASAALSIPIAWHMKSYDSVAFMADIVAVRRSLRWHWGAEYRFLDAYAVRAGGYDDHLTMGAGIRCGRVTVDYAADFCTLEVFNRFSFSWSWGNARSRMRPKADKRPGYGPALTREAQKALDEQRKNRKIVDRAVRPVFKLAIREYSDGNFISATEMLNGILLEHPEYEGAAYYLNRIKEQMIKESGEDTLDFERSSYARGYQAYYGQRFSDALREWERILQLNPKRDEIKKYAGLTAAYLRDQDRLQRERELEQSAADILDRGRRLFDAGRWIPCIKAMESLQERCRKESFMRAMEYHGRAQEYIDRAVKALSRTIAAQRVTPTLQKEADEVDEAGAERRYREGLVLYAQGKPLEAEKVWEIALRLNPGHEKARRALEKVRQ